MKNLELQNAKDTIHKYIPFLHGFSEIRTIQKGYSSDGKFKIRMLDGREYLLKIFDQKDLKTKQREYEVLRKMEQFQVRCSRPIDMGGIAQNEQGYMILSFIEGQDAEQSLHHYSDEIQYEIGFQAGLELHKMHQYNAPDSISGWYERKLKKHRRYFEQYQTCGYKINHDSKIMSFIDDHCALMDNRPNLFQHDDYHPGNIIIKDRNLSGIVDFACYDWGDPVHEFLKVGLLSSEISVPFSVGQIKGYHHGHEPDELFWKLYSIYLAMSIFSSIVWVLKVKPDELNPMVQKLHRVLEDHQYFDQIKPRWYE